MSTRNISSAEASEPATESDADVESSAESTSAESETERLSLDIVFEILRNERRRLVLKYLRDNEEEATLGHLAEHIAALENNISVKALDAQQRKRVYVGLYQCHLPKMDDADVIDFNQSRGTIELRDGAERLEQYLDTDDDADRVTTSHYLSLAGGGIVAYAAALVAGSTLVCTAVGFLVIGAILALATFDWYGEE